MKTESMSVGKLLKLGFYVLVIFSLLILIRTQGKHLNDSSAQQQGISKTKSTESAIVYQPVRVYEAISTQV